MSNDPFPLPSLQVPEDVESGKVMAALCYLWYPLPIVGLVVTIICLAQAKNAFAVFHGKQSLMLCIFLVASSLLAIVLIGFLGLLFGLVLMILGILNALRGQYKPLPLIGGFAEKWFAGIQKKA